LNQLAIYATCYEQLIIKNGEMKNYIMGYQITFSLCAQQQYQILVMRCCKKHRIFDCLYCYYECQKKKKMDTLLHQQSQILYTSNEMKDVKTKRKGWK